MEKQKSKKFHQNSDSKYEYNEPGLMLDRSNGALTGDYKILQIVSTQEEWLAVYDLRFQDDNCPQEERFYFNRVACWVLIEFVNGSEIGKRQVAGLVGTEEVGALIEICEATANFRGYISKKIKIDEFDNFFAGLK